MKNFLEILDPQSFASQFNTVRKPDLPDPPGRPDMADVIDMENLSIEEINDSVLEAEIKGGLPRMEYPLPVEPR